MSKDLYKNIPSVKIENENIRLVFLPGYGCKMASFINKKTNREILFQSSKDSLDIPPYAAPFNKYDSSGYDEVFPSIDRCPYPSGKYEGVIIPDHGEIWAMEWTVEHHTNTELTASVKSNHFPYIFRRHISLKDSEVHITYTVENTDKEEEFKFLWALHALLACDENTVLLTPENLNEIMTVEHSTENLGPWGTTHPYPLTKSVLGKEIDMSKTEPVTANNCEKFYFTSKNTEGWCGVEHTLTGEQIIYEYDYDKIPYLGVWKTQGGYRGDYNIAVEPCTGVYDDLYVANKIRKYTSVRAGESYSWNFRICLRQSK
ncbi:Galactose mutarotase [Parelusimicrobium proximum]|uniref:aldose epimerase family protein n=1 Tax=Parelusimicrobium proximum TaxID=3228953 RepID=UPI003D16D20B